MKTIWNDGWADGSGRPHGCQRAGLPGSTAWHGAGQRAGLAASESAGRFPARATIQRGTALLASLGRRGGALLAAVLLALPAPALQSAEPAKRVAVLDIELLKADYLPDPDRITSEERQRLDMIAALIRDRLRVEGYDPVPAAQTRAAIQAADPGQYLHACNGCEQDIARELGADWVAVGWIQFVSYLILNLNVMVVDVESGAPVARAFVDLRGNTERSWRRATTYMLDHILVERLARRR